MTTHHLQDIREFNQWLHARVQREKSALYISYSTISARNQERWYREDKCREYINTAKSSLFDPVFTWMAMHCTWLPEKQPLVFAAYRQLLAAEPAGLREASVTRAKCAVQAMQEQGV